MRLKALIALLCVGSLLALTSSDAFAHRHSSAKVYDVGRIVPIGAPVEATSGGVIFIDYAGSPQGLAASLSSSYEPTQCIILEMSPKAGPPPYQVVTFVDIRAFKIRGSRGWQRMQRLSAQSDCQ